MPVIVPPHNESRKIASLLTDLELRMKRAEAGLRQAQLGNSSLSGGLNMYDADGNIRGVVGQQPDGTITSTSINNPIPPPVMIAPSVTPTIAGLSVTHDGGTADGSSLPADWSHLNIYTALTGLPEVRTLSGTLSRLPGEFPIAPLEYMDYVVTVTSVNQSGTESAHSMPSSGTPTMVVGTDILDGIVTEVKLANEAVAQAKIKLGAVGTGQIAGSAVDLSKLANGSVDATKLVTGAVTTAKIAPLAVTGAELASNSVVAGKVAANAITAGTIAANAVTAGTIAATTITANELAANSVIAGKIAANAVTANEIAALSITSGKIVTDAIQSTHIVADAITTAKIAALAVTTNEIAANAITAGQITTGAVTATKLAANLVIAERIIAGNATGNRVELHPTVGLQAYKSAGATRTFWLDASTGNAFFMGEINTAVSGTTRIAINPGGTSPDTIRFYPGSGSQYASIDSYDAGGGYAGLSLYGSASSNDSSIFRGMVVLRKEYASLALGRPDFGSAFLSEVYVEPQFTRAKSAVIDLIVDERISPPSGTSRRVAMITWDSAGNARIPTLLQYETTSANGGEPFLIAAGMSSGFVFAPGFSGGLPKIYCRSNNNAGYVNCFAANFVEPSSEVLKEQIRNLEGEFDSVAILRNVKPKKYKMVSEKTKLVAKDAGGKDFDEIAIPDAEVQTHIGFIAEDLPADLKVPGHDGDVPIEGVVPTRLIAVLWDATQKILTQLDAQAVDIADIKTKLPKP